MWSAFSSAAIARHVPTFEEEELTPSLLRSFRPWPAALLSALDELEIPSADARLIVEALSPSAAAAPVSRPAPASARADISSLNPSLATAPAFKSDPDGGLDCCFVNLATRADRRRTMEAALRDAELADAERVEAVTSASASVVGTHWDT